MNPIVTTRVHLEHLENGGCNGFVIKCVDRTYTEFTCLNYIAICMKVQIEYRLCIEYTLRVNGIEIK